MPSTCGLQAHHLHPSPVAAPLPILMVTTSLMLPGQTYHTSQERYTAWNTIWTNVSGLNWWLVINPYSIPWTSMLDSYSDRLSQSTSSLQTRFWHKSRGWVSTWVWQSWHGRVLVQKEWWSGPTAWDPLWICQLQIWYPCKMKTRTEFSETHLRMVWPLMPMYSKLIPASPFMQTMLWSCTDIIENQSFMSIQYINEPSHTTCLYTSPLELPCKGHMSHTESGPECC